jgi:hypothetical protein
MNERDHLRRWVKKFKLAHPSALVVRIADSPVCRKPFDIFILMDAVFTAIEFKVGGAGLLPHQRRELLTVKANGGIAKVIRFMEKGETVEEVL